MYKRQDGSNVLISKKKEEALTGGGGGNEEAPRGGGGGGGGGNGGGGGGRDAMVNLYCLAKKYAICDFCPRGRRQDQSHSFPSGTTRLASSGGTSVSNTWRAILRVSK